MEEHPVEQLSKRHSWLLLQASFRLTLVQTDKRLCDVGTMTAARCPLQPCLINNSKNTRAGLLKEGLIPSLTFTERQKMSGSKSSLNCGTLNGCHQFTCSGLARWDRLQCCCVSLEDSHHLFFPLQMFVRL